MDHFISPIAVFLASLLGSAHCVAMCGPILATFSTETRGRIHFYHLGRLASYVGLGAVAGWLGESLFPYRSLGNLAAICLALFFLWSAYRLWRGKREFSLFPQTITDLVARALSKNISQPNVKSHNLFLIGVLTALLPCGWLHTFVVAAVTTGSAGRGALVLFAFWIGTIPALTLGMSLIKSILGPVGKRYPTLVGLFLVVAATATIALRVSPPGRYSPVHSGCHVKPTKQAVPESTKTDAP